MSKRKVRMGRHRPVVWGEAVVAMFPTDAEMREAAKQIRRERAEPFKFIVDEASDLHARDFLIPPLDVGETVFVTNSDRPEKNGVRILRPEGFLRPAVTKEQAPWLSIWAE